VERRAAREHGVPALARRGALEREVASGYAAPTQETPMAGEISTNTLLLVIIAILLPPLAVFLKTSSLGQTLLNILLCLIFYLPGLLHALWVILK
jgi:uncharacterized membrane protein YqaE (UPF0057 family)